MRLLVVFLSLFLVPVNGDVVFSCPGTIQDLRDGVFPAGATDLTAFPDKYYCSISFIIPDGYIVRFDANALLRTLNGGSDHLTISDNFGRTYDINGTTAVFAPAIGAQLVLTTTTGYSFFFVRWTFVNVGAIEPVIKKKGAFGLSLPSQVPWSYEPDDSIQFETAGEPSDQIFVYDGKNLSAKCIGRLVSFETGTLKSFGHGLTLVNYGPYIVNNDASGMAAKLSDLTNFTSWQFLENSPNAYTLIRAKTAVSIYCGFHCYIEDLKIAEPSGYVAISSRQPGYAPARLSYTGTDDFEAWMPQEVLPYVITVTSFNSDASIRLTTKSFGDYQLRPGRRSKIISRNYWDPSYDGFYSQNYKSYQGEMTLNFNVTFSNTPSYVSNLTIAIIDADQNSSIVYSYLGKSTDPDRYQTANGTEMQVKFVSNSYTDWFIMDFGVELAVPLTSSTTTTTPTPSTSPSTTPKVTTTEGEDTTSVSSSTTTTKRAPETTTRSSCSVSIFSTILTVLTASCLLVV